MRKKLREEVSKKEWFITFAEAELSDYDPDNGVGDYAKSFTIKIKKSHDSLEGIIKDLNRNFGAKLTKGDFIYTNNIILTRVTVDEDNFYVSNDDIYRQQKTKHPPKFYLADISIGLDVVEGRREANEEDFEAEGIFG